MYTYRRWRTHTACGLRTPPTVRVYLSTLIHDSDAHRRFLRYAYAIFRPSGCVGTPRGLKQRWETVWRRLPISAISLKPRAACQSASQCDCSLSYCFVLIYSSKTRYIVYIYTTKRVYYYVHHNNIEVVIIMNINELC